MTPKQTLLKPVATLALLTLVAGCASIEPCFPRDEAAIRAVLERQARDWNEGSIERFMQGYAKCDDIRFASGGSVERGWQPVFDRYVKKYGDRAAMGRLTFSEVEITMLSPDSALVLGRWRLQRETDEPSGLFTLIFRHLPEGWRIVHDHTSAAELK